MLKRALDLKESLNEFLTFYKTPGGRKEFNYAKTELDKIEDKEWATIHGICHLLGSFDTATELLSGENYSTFVAAFPVLRKLKEKIKNDSMFTFDNVDIVSSKFKRSFYGRYGNEPFFKNVVCELNSCRTLLLNDFDERFKALDASIVWTTLLDPRFSLNSHHWKNNEEMRMVKDLFFQNIEAYAIMRENKDSISDLVDDISHDGDDYSDDENAIDLFESKTPFESQVILPTISISEAARVLYGLL